MIRLLLSVTLTFCALMMHAQTFLDNLRANKQGQGRVTVVQSPEIDSLVNGRKPIKPVQVKPAEKQTTTPSTVIELAKPSDKTAERTTDRPIASQSEKTTSDKDSNIEENTVIDTRKKVMRNSYKTKGYRIQVFSGGNSRVDRQKAENAGTAMKAHFPSEPVYVHFYSPSWKCRMGNYTDLAKAREILAQVKKLGFKQACIIKGTISVQY